MDDTYGHCGLNDAGKICKCLSTGWLGRLCVNWVPISSLLGEAPAKSAGTYEELQGYGEYLLARAKKIRAINEEK